MRQLKDEHIAFRLKVLNEIKGVYRIDEPIRRLKTEMSRRKYMGVNL